MELLSDQRARARLLCAIRNAIALPRCPGRHMAPRSSSPRSTTDPAEHRCSNSPAGANGPERVPRRAPRLLGRLLSVRGAKRGAAATAGSDVVKSTRPWPNCVPLSTPWATEDSPRRRWPPQQDPSASGPPQDLPLSAPWAAEGSPGVGGLPPQPTRGTTAKILPVGGT
jgi:hypothetical protein